MAQQKVELRKIRDFSDNLNDTFLFIRQNLKPLLTAFLGIAGIFMVATAIISGLYQSDMGSVFQDIINGTRNGSNASPLSMFNGKYFLVLLFSWMNIVAMQVAITAYMKVYEANNGETPSVDDVWKVFRSYYLLLVIYSIPILILIVIGLMLCILPGIYVIVVTIPFTAIVMMEDRTFGETFNRCFVLNKNNFWASFGLYLLVYIIYAFSSGIISGAVGALAGLIYYFSTKNLATTVGLVSSILSIFSFVFYIVYYVSVVLQYFNLSEKFDGTGMMRKLETLGDSSPNFDNTQEEY